MIEYNQLEAIDFADNEPCVAAIGFFDGVHIAHQAIVNECIKRARKHHCKSVVFTFQNHPSSVLSPTGGVPLLSPYPLKAMRLERMGIDVLMGIPFDEELSQISAQSFVEDILIKQIHAKEIVVGYNFKFGHKRGGDSGYLQSYEGKGFDAVNVIASQQLAGKPISSSLTRKAIQEGRLHEAEKLLGRRYHLYGEVIHGDGRGAAIGFPTANIDTQNQLLPPNGIYGVRVWRNSFDSEPLWGAMNVGVVPTFKDEAKPVAEVYLLDHKEDLYGQKLIVEICHYVREERKYDGVDALVAAIENDIQEIRGWISEND